MADGPDTSTVTAGKGGKRWQAAAGINVSKHSDFNLVLIMLDELLKLYGNHPIDCEFAGH